MSDVKREQLLEALKTIIHPTLNKNIVDLGIIQGLVSKDGNVGFAINIDPDEAEEMEKLRLACDRLLLQINGVNKVTSLLTAERNINEPNAPQENTKQFDQKEFKQKKFDPKKSTVSKKTGDGTPPPLPNDGPASIPGVKHVIAIASGKGGVGKSTTAINLALAFNKLGLKAGIFDLDIYGPSIPRLMGLSDGKPELVEGDKITPLQNHNIVSMSIGYLMDKETAAIWRGPMVIGAIQQMVRDVKWDLYGEIDVLVLDLPPGTGDAQLTMTQGIKLDGAVIVSTPQDLALIDARKALAMFDKTSTKVFGIIENMSYFICPHCGERSDIFSHGGAEATAKEKSMDFLGSIPLDIDIRQCSDDGTPIVACQEDSPHTKSYVAIADKILAKF